MAQMLQKLPPFEFKVLGKVKKKLLSNHAGPRACGFPLSDVSRVWYLLCCPSLGLAAGYGDNIVWTASHLTCLEWVPVALEQSGVEQ